jgi:putative transcriptional regulator
MTEKNNYLAQHFLVAMPTLNDPTFKKSVVYVYEHNEKGAMGMVINKPMQINLGNILKHLGIDSIKDDVITLPVLMGGPVGQEHGFILYQAAKKKQKSIEITASKDMLERIATGKGPNDFLVTLGYAGWTSGQIEQEVARNDWLIVPADPTILFTTPIGQRWQGAAQLIGVDINQISSLTGRG